MANSEFERLDATELPGIDETISAVREMAHVIADLIDEERDEFDADDFEVVDAYVFGSVAEGEGIPGESDLDIALCVPAWDAPNNDLTHAASHRSVADDVIRALVARSDELISDKFPEKSITRIDVWIAEPMFHCEQLNTELSSDAFYFPGEDGVYRREEAIRRLGEAR